MNKDEYKKLVREVSPKENKLKNCFFAFFIGGLVGLSGEVIINIIMRSFGESRVDSYSWLAFIIILFATFMTAIGKFDDWVSKAKCGLIIPTTGFAHSIQSSALDYKKEGLITGIGANVFKLAGAVILYGIVSAFFFALLKVIVYG